MGIIEIIIIAIVEAMDCFAVAVSTGLAKSGIRYSRAFMQAVSFGVFQGGMTVLGFFLGGFAERWFNAVGTPIACTILCILGGRMIWGAIRGNASEEEGEKIATKNLTVANILLYPSPPASTPSPSGFRLHSSTPIWYSPPARLH